MDSHSFCRMLLSSARQDYKDELNRQVPKLSVTKSSIGGYEVVGPDRFYHYSSSACCTWSAKAEAIDHLISAKEGE